jgi:hypothetical protein
MGIFDFFKKKQEPSYDPTNITIKDLQKGFVLDYDMKSWVVREAYIYDWGGHYFTREYKLDSGDDSCYLHVDTNDDLSLTVSRKIKVRSIDEDLPEYIQQHEHPPKKVHYQGVTYLLDKESPGYFRDLADPDREEYWSELVSWEYYDEQEKNFISVEQWGEREFEAAIGKTAEAYQFSNILPGE